MKRKVKYGTGGSKVCDGCGEIFQKKPKQSYDQWEACKTCSIACMAAWMKTRRGESTSHWKGKDVGYAGIHIWLVKNYGKANLCEAADCSGRSKIFEWAMIHEKGYGRERDNFKQLCRACHRSYDLTPEKLEKITSYLPWARKKIEESPELSQTLKDALV